METVSRSTGNVKLPRLKRVGLALAGLWLIVLVAAASASIYRGVDGPTVKSTMAKNQNLTSIIATLSNDLDTAQSTINQLNIELMDSRSDHAALKIQLESYLSSAPLIQIRP